MERIPTKKLIVENNRIPTKVLFLSENKEIATSDKEISTPDLEEKVLETKNTLDLTKEFKTKNHKYIIEQSINTISGEANLFIATDESNNKVVIKLYRTKLDEKQRGILLDFLKNVDSSSGIMPVLDDGYSNDYPFDVIPFFPDGDLASFKEISVEFLKEHILPKLNNAIKYMHDNNIIHRDIKPDNIFYDKHKDELYIGDFGIASMMQQGSSLHFTKTGRGTEGYTAPEVFQKNVCFESDYFSLGITIASLIKGKYVFDGLDESDIFLRIYNQSFANFIVDENLRLLVCGLTLQDIKMRFGYKEVEDYLDNIPLRNVINVASMTSNFKTPYSFEGEQYSNIVKLGEAMASNYTRAVEHLKRGYFLTFLQQEDASLAVIVSESCDKCKNYNDALALILLQFHLPTLINYKNLRFKDLLELADYMASIYPKIDDDIVHLFDNGFILTACEYLVRISDTKKNNEILTVVKDFKNKDNDLNYFLFMYVFSKNKPSFVIFNKTITKIEEFFNLLKDNPLSPYLLYDALVTKEGEALFLADDATNGSQLLKYRNDHTPEMVYIEFLKNYSDSLDLTGFIKNSFTYYLITNNNKYKYKSNAKQIKKSLINVSKLPLSNNDECLDYIEKANEVLKKFYLQLSDNFLIDSKNIIPTQEKYCVCYIYNKQYVTLDYLQSIKEVTEDKNKALYISGCCKKTIGYYDEILQAISPMFRNINDSYLAYYKKYYYIDNLSRYRANIFFFIIYLLLGGAFYVYLHYKLKDDLDNKCYYLLIGLLGFFIINNILCNIKKHKFSSIRTKIAIIDKTTDRMQNNINSLETLKTKSKVATFNEKKSKINHKQMILTDKEKDIALCKKYEDKVLYTKFIPNRLIHFTELIGYMALLYGFNIMIVFLFTQITKDKYGELSNYIIFSIPLGSTVLVALFNLRRKKRADIKWSRMTLAFIFSLIFTAIALILLYNYVLKK